MPIRSEVSVNEVNKELRAMRVSVEDLKRAGLIIRGRTGRGQKYKVKHLERVNDLKESLQRSLKPNGGQGRLFGVGESDLTVPLVDVLHLLIGLSEAGEPVTEWLEKLAPEKPHSQYAHNVGEDNADAHLKRTIMGREVVVAVTAGKLDFGPWERIFYGEFDGRRRKRVLVKIVGA